MGRSDSGIPFEHDDYWVEAPGAMWTPELEHKCMPIREPTPGELADTARKRGSSEDESCPADPLLANLDFTSEYISPTEQDHDFKDQLQKYHHHIKFIEGEDELIYIDWDDEDW
jgi:hypothetical protein